MSTEVWISFIPLLVMVLVIGLIWAKLRRNAKAAPLVSGGAPIPEYRGPLAFFRRHYNGDYSLGRSYWVNTMLISLVALVIGAVLIPWLSQNFPARYASAAILLLLFGGIAAWFWAASGTWASANKHVQRGGKAGWAAAAKLAIVLGVIRIFGDVSNQMPAVQEHLRVATGAQRGADTKLEVRADGKSILLSGGINDGSADQLEKALQMAPAVTTVVFSSAGGWLREGRILAAVIRKRRLNTYVEGYCASACTIAFLAGKERAADPTAKIGFHSSRSIGSMTPDRAPEETSELRAIYQDANLPEAFISQALDTPYEKMWHPSHDELLAAGVLTRKSAGGETAAIATAIRSKDSLVAEFRKVDMFAALAGRSPEDFNRVIDAAWAKMQSGATDAEVISAGRAQLVAIVPRYLPIASDEALIAYQMLVQEQLEALRGRDAKSCVEMVFPSGYPMNLASNLPPELLKRELALIARTFREADAARRIRPSEQEVAEVARRAAKSMTPEQIAAFSDDSARRRNPPLVTCDAAIAFFVGLNAIPAPQRGYALRVFYSGG